MRKLLRGLLVLLSLSGCAASNQQNIAEMTLPEPLPSFRTLNDDEFLHQISIALAERFPPGTEIAHVIEYARRLNGECDVETNMLNFSFGQWGPQRDFLSCSIPERSAFLFRATIDIAADIEDEKIKSLKVSRTKASFP
jgi:hypothetical protein